MTWILPAISDAVKSKGIPTAVRFQTKGARPVNRGVVSPSIVPVLIAFAAKGNWSITQLAQNATCQAVVPGGLFVGELEERATKRQADPSEKPDVYGISLQPEVSPVHMGTGIIEEIPKMIVCVQALVCKQCQSHRYI
jgi:hypothetical protein